MAMKKAISILMCLALVMCSVLALAGCSKQKQAHSDIVLITDGGNINDGSYNKSAWEGITQYAADNAMTARYYQPALEDGELNTDTVEKYVDLAAQNGAKFIIFPGEKLSVSAYEVAPLYPDINFILIDGTPHSNDDNIDHYIPNVMSITFDPIQSGFLAGYISVVSGNTRLGYFGQFSSNDSANYGAGFVQGAAFAADMLGKPVTVDWADYDSPLIDYNYSLKVTAVYQKIEDCPEETHKVVVENGIGTGVYTTGSNVTITADPAPEGQTFDRWEIKSNTEGVKDKKVNVSSTTKSSMNLLVEKCDCTLTAVYKDIEGTVYPVTVMSPDSKDVYSLTSVEENGSCEISAPPAPINMVFDHWESNVIDTVEDETSSVTNVNVTDTGVKVTPMYRASDIPTFNLTVVTGEGGDGDSSGSGSYLAGDKVTIAAAVPAEGYMFSHWTNEDSKGNSAGVSMENEYYWNTSFEMVDRFASLVEDMYDSGITMVFAGGNNKEESVYTAKDNFDFDLGVIASGANHKGAYSAIIKNYGEAAKDCLEDFKGGQKAVATCATDGIYASFVSDDKEVQVKFDEIYKALAENKIRLIGAQGGAGFDFCSQFTSRVDTKCLSLHGWFLTPILDDDD
jgi:basic membrane lipoprotein Med (substrate-binding protein (PBP1-ABC) superfamily)